MTSFSRRACSQPSSSRASCIGARRKASRSATMLVPARQTHHRTPRRAARYPSTSGNSGTASRHKNLRCPVTPLTLKHIDAQSPYVMRRVASRRLSFFPSFCFLRSVCFLWFFWAGFLGHVNLPTGTEELRIKYQMMTNRHGRDLHSDLTHDDTVRRKLPRGNNWLAPICDGCMKDGSQIPKAWVEADSRPEPAKPRSNLDNVPPLGTSDETLVAVLFGPGDEPSDKSAADKMRKEIADFRRATQKPQFPRAVQGASHKGKEQGQKGTLISSGRVSEWRTPSQAKGWERADKTGRTALSKGSKTSDSNFDDVLNSEGGGWMHPRNNFQGRRSQPLRMCWATLLYSKRDIVVV